MLEVDELAAVRNQQLLFKKLSFQLDAGQLLHIVGANGAGKSTLLQILAGLRLPTAGRVAWQGRDIHRQYWDYSFSNYVGHKLAVKQQLTVLEHLPMYASLRRCVLNTSWHGLLERFSLQQQADQLAKSLSAGQRQRLALTRLAILSASLWLLDEPLTALDNHGRQLVQQLICQHLITGGMVVMTSHQAIHWPEIPIQRLELCRC